MEFLAIIVLAVLALTVARLHSRVGRVEQELATFIAAQTAVVASETTESTIDPAEIASVSSVSSLPAPLEIASEDVVTELPEPPAAELGPWGTSEPSMETNKKPDIETALGTRWAVWVGGLALALGGIFMVRYSIEAGIFGPRARLVMAVLFGLLLAGAGEVARRKGFKVPLEGFRGAHVPGILTAAAAFTLFGAVYAAHGVYGFIGPGIAFTLLGLIGVAAVVAAVLHGKALAALGLLGSLVTPVLVASDSQNPWVLFIYLAIILTATAFIARLRSWAWIMGMAFAGCGIWGLIYLASTVVPAISPVAFINLIMLGVLVIIWLRGDPADSDLAPIGSGVDRTSVVPAFLTATTAILIGSVPDLAVLGGTYFSAALLVAMVIGACYRFKAITLLYASGVATLSVYLGSAFGNDFDITAPGRVVAIDGVPVSDVSVHFVSLGFLIGATFLVAGVWNARKYAVARSVRGASWAGWASLAPLGMLAITWFAFGNIDRDISYAIVALVLTGALIASAEWVARAEMPPMGGKVPVSLLLIGASAGTILTILMAFGAGPTTILIGIAAAVPAFATRYRVYPILGWLSAGLAGVTLAHIAFDPTIVGTNILGKTPVFNWLLAGYGLPALGFGFAAWQLAKTRPDTRPRQIMEAFAALFGLLTVAMLVRHAMNGGIINSGAPSLGEQAIYTLIAIGGSGILIALDARAPSPVFRYGALVIGVISVVLIAIAHFIGLNPLTTNASTGTIPVFNLLLLAYLMPAVAMAALAIYARGKRPRWYVATLAVVSAILAFAYATLSVRRLFQGEFIGAWKGMTQLETYSYSALWLVMGVALLALGARLRSVPLRIASAALVVVAVAKAFLFDMSQLEGFLRALSFIGLGGVLIGIGLFYQRMLISTAAKK
ncbi:DUF2339 domain-containing protein [Mesorhizobium sp. NBSH29]|uniref:DUF2339 domain-containing protein n=1 Tax=Mesorhizobium sp. NBSH29 TaxID=2654249 RepID=UPI001896A096|nr:DUF2339 domain-containing protein [Mesorhizobium sp. NBSH29]QPC87276.1 DUF2339 domain-containing protein [Mesorhizobium sp. NBSH29]